MRLTVSEMAKRSGVSVRTLHYYDQIGLLKPDFIDGQNGYRYYGGDSLERLQAILFYRELDFPLKEIQTILSSPDYNKTQALSNQIQLLTLKKERLERLIEALTHTLKGENQMNFDAFDNSEYEMAKEKYAEEVRKRWGDTVAYQESMKKISSYSNEQFRDIQRQSDEILQAFAACATNGNLPSSQAAQTLVKRWADFITRHYYACDKKMLASLGEMYVADERFTENINRFGKGTADFVRQAIAVYCAESF